MKHIKPFYEFITEELHILKSPTDEETEEAFNDLKPGDRLVWCIDNNQPQFLQRLFDNEEIDVDSDYVQSEFFYVIRNDKLDIVKVFIENGMNIEVEYNTHDTPLLYAVSYGKENIVKYLVEQGANLEAKDECGRTSLFYCMVHNKTNLAKYLIEKGANVNTKKGRVTPLKIAITNQNEELIDILKKHGAK